VDGPLNIATNLSVTGNARVELAANSRWTGGSFDGDIHLLPNVELMLAVTNGPSGFSLSLPTPGILRKTTDAALSIRNANGTFITNTSLIEILAGTLSTLPLNEAFFVQQAGKTHIASGATLITAALRLNGGEITGAGTVHVRSISVNRGNHLDATVSPGEPYGKLTFAGEGIPIWKTNSVAVIDIGGANAGADHDQIASERAIRIEGGTLTVRTAGGFVPAVGQEFTIFTFTSRQGTFATVTGLELGNGQKYRVIYENTAIKLRVE
jgi:hypothetical protein